MKTAFGTCEVHKYALNDATFRRVYWCDVCKAWICSECQDKYFRRLYAALLRWIDRNLTK
jgi:hypothetical protein